MAFPWLAVIGLIPKLVELAEFIFSKVPKSGEQKKELVMGVTKEVVNTMKSISTGGQKETWEEIEAPISSAVDSIAGTIFPSSERIEDIQPSG